VAVQQHMCPACNHLGSHISIGQCQPPCVTHRRQVYTVRESIKSRGASGSLTHVHPHSLGPSPKQHALTAVVKAPPSIQPQALGIPQSLLPLRALLLRPPRAAAASLKYFRIS
jgi:hypothetical protein